MLVHVWEKYHHSTEKKYDNYNLPQTYPQKSTEILRTKLENGTRGPKNMDSKNHPKKNIAESESSELR